MLQWFGFWFLLLLQILTDNVDIFIVELGAVAILLRFPFVTGTSSRETPPSLHPVNHFQSFWAQGKCRRDRLSALCYFTLKRQLACACISVCECVRTCVWVCERAPSPGSFSESVGHTVGLVSLTSCSSGAECKHSCFCFSADRSSLCFLSHWDHH